MKILKPQTRHAFQQFHRQYDMMQTLIKQYLFQVTALHDEFKRHGDRVESLLQETLSIANITKKKIVLLSNEQREMQNESSQSE